jgi:hypothetical protein
LEDRELRTTRVVEQVAGAADRAELAAAECNGAPQPVLELLRRLPDRQPRQVRALWTEASDGPVGA